MTRFRGWGLAVVALAGCLPGPARLAPEARDPDWGPLVALLDSAVADGAAPGAVVGISWRGQWFSYGTGRLGQHAGRRPDGATIYDLASVTKVVTVTTLAMQAVNEGRLDLDQPIARYLGDPLPAWAGQVTTRHLLTHTSGLPAHRRLWTLAPGPDSARRVVRHTPLDTVPGARTVYSDLGLILLGEIIERQLGAPLDRLVAERITGPLGMTETRFLPPAAWRARIAPTEQDPWRGRMIRGEVHDENAAFLGGVSGHAGLFGTTADLLRFGEWLVGAVRSEGTILSGERWLVQGAIPRQFTTRALLVPGSSRALGWDTPTEQALPGVAVAPGAVWHTGFTGTAIWVDPAHQLVLVLLTNRVHPTRENNRHVALRRAVATYVFQRVGGASR